MHIKLKTEYGDLLCITDKNWNTRSVTFRDNQMIYQQFIVCDAVKYEFDELYKKIKTLVTDLSNNGIEFNVKEDFKAKNTKIKDMKLRDNILIVSILRGRNIITPNGNEVIKR